MTKKSILAGILLFVSIGLAQKTIAQENPFYNYKGKLIIVGGGNMPDSLFTFFANYCGGKDQPIVYIPTATTDEEYIKDGGHLVKFTSRGFTNLSTIHTRDKVKADDPKLIPGESDKVLEADPNSRELLLEPAEDAVSAKAIEL